MNSSPLLPILVTKGGTEIPVVSYSEGQLWSDYFELYNSERWDDDSRERILEESTDSPITATRTYELPVTAGTNEFIINDGISTFRLIATVGGSVPAVNPVTPPIEGIQPRPPIQVVINGRYITFDQPPVNVDSRILVPLRLIFKALGACVDWNEATQTVTAVKDDTRITLQIGSNTLNRNGTQITLDVPAQIIGGRTMVPARAVVESFGANVNWEGATQTVTITD